ncbi:MAG: GNAT family N-acetyltransferase [Chloroflexi bacterium]|nr:GNAT family N-acetyltransferase [Chloroflexota bacterium]
MKQTSLFNATTIRLTALDTKEDAPALAAWTQDGRYLPLQENTPPHPMSVAQAKKMLDELLKEADEKRNSFWFGIRTLDETELLGIIGLGWVDWSNGAAYMKINMKELAEYSKTYTEEALALMQRYVFHELQMHRLSLTTQDYNDGLVAVLQKMGFAEEVRHREAVYRYGRRWDSLHFGMLAADWQKGLNDE